MSDRNLSGKLRSVMDVISEHWPFDPDHYPILRGVEPDGVRDFARIHMILHIVKNGGLLTEIQEFHEHKKPGTLSPEEWYKTRKLAMKVIVSGLRLFMATGGRPEELERYIKKEDR